MHNWPLDVIHLIITKFQETEDPISEGEYWRDKCTMSTLASCSQGFRSIAQPLMFEVVFINGFKRAEQLQDILRVNPILVLNTKTLVIEYDGDKPTSDCNLAWLPQLGRMFTYFKNLTCLHFSRMDMESGSEYATLRSSNFRTVKQVIIDYCYFSSFPSLWALTELFPALVHMSLNFSFAYNSNDQHQRKPENELPISSLSLSELLYLHIQPNYACEVEMRWLCESLVRSTRLQSLHTLSIQVSRKPASLIALRTLLCHTAPTLVTLTVAWKTESAAYLDSHIPLVIPEIDSLPQLQRLVLKDLVNWASDFHIIADIFARISGAASQLSKVVIDMDVNSSLHTTAKQLWSAIEAANVHSQYMVTIKYNTCMRWGPQECFTESDVREALPRTDGRGGLHLELCPYEQYDDDDCMADTQSPFA